MKNKILFFINLFIAVIFTTYFMVKIINRYVLGNGPYVKKISIYSEDKNISDVLFALGVTNTTKIDSLDLNKMNDQISGVSYIKRYSVKKSPNNILYVKIEKYKPVALWNEGKYYFLISSDGKIISKNKKLNTDFIVIKGKIPKDIVSIISELQGLLKNVDYIEWIEDRRWNIFLKNGLLLKLPEKEPCKRLKSFLSVNKVKDVFSKNIDFIDLRNENFIIKMK